MNAIWMLALALALAACASKGECTTELGDGKSTWSGLARGKADENAARVESLADACRQMCGATKAAAIDACATQCAADAAGGKLKATTTCR